LRCSALSDNALRPALGFARLTRAFGVAAAIGRGTIIFLLFGEAAAA
jgi:hypothetical protein